MRIITITPETLGVIATEQDAKCASILMEARGWNPDGTGRYAEDIPEDEMQAAWEADMVSVIADLG